MPPDQRGRLADPCSCPSAWLGMLKSLLIQVRGYVKSVSAAGAFVALARDLEARVKLNNLADGYVEEPKTAFPEGQLVTGRVIATDHNRCSL